MDESIMTSLKKIKDMCNNILEKNNGECDKCLFCINKSCRLLDDAPKYWELNEEKIIKYFK